MKTSDSFKKTIKAYLDKRASEDELFAVSYKKDNKNIDECVNFILNSVKESGCNGFDDDEIYSIAVHYYDEDELDAKYLKQIGCNVVVNHKPVLTEEDKKELEQKAKDDYYNECLRKQRELVNKPKKVVKKEVEQLSLF